MNLNLTKQSKLILLSILILILLGSISYGGYSRWKMGDQESQSKGDNTTGETLGKINPANYENNDPIYNPVNVIAEENPVNSKLTDIYLENYAGEREFFGTLTDIRRGIFPRSLSPMDAEYRNGNLYIEKRISYSDYPDEKWTDELWKYYRDGGKERIHFSKGLEFKVSPNDRYAVFSASRAGEENLNVTERLIFKHLEDKSSKTLLPEDLGLKGKFIINLTSWSSNSRYFWVTAHEIPYKETPPQKILIKIDTGTWSFEKFTISGISGEDFSFNPDAELILYSNYPVFFDDISRKEYEAKGETVRLYVYDPKTEKKTEVSQSTAERFSPKWMDMRSFEYIDPATNQKTIKKVEMDKLTLTN